MNTHVIASIFRRNFASYFSSPIGYVFICAFVLLSAFAAFWPNEFFNANLANLDQLNKSLPWIMLVIIPAITMSIWADERRQGTDELLLTLPAGDLEVVIGKYLASLAIFTVALLFSFFNIFVLYGLGSPDGGLLLGNYLGYFIVGAGMLALGMAASFLTANLTVSFILAAAFNAPLAFAASADAIFPRDIALRLKQFSIAEQFRDFGQGVVALRGVVFFVTLAGIALYLCMVFIGRRHWAGRRAGLPMSLHYAVRFAALIAIAVAANAVAGWNDVRADLSRERINSLSPQTKSLLENLDPARPVLVEAYVSPVVPEEYVQTRLDLLNMLREISARGGRHVTVRVNEAESFSQAAAEAEQQFGITTRQVQSRQRGSYSQEEVILGAAFLCGLDKVVVPFFDRGIPVEYEIIRSLATVSQQQRKRIGVVNTDARMFGGFDMQSMSRRPEEQIVEELKKQYEVVPVEASQPIAVRYDALLVVQPSSLTQPQLDNVIAAVKSGQPTAIFEDPFPYIDTTVAATSQPRMPPGGPFGRQMPEPKGDIQKLWDVLQIHMPRNEVIWQRYNAYPKIREFPPEFIFVDHGCGAEEPFSNASPVTSGLQQLMVLFAGPLRPAPGATLQFTPLVRTGRQTGNEYYEEMIQRGFLGQMTINPQRPLRPTGEPYTVAAHVRGRLEPQPANPPDGQGAPPAATEINAIVVSDIDMLYSVFFHIRAQGSDPEAPIDLKTDNVPFTLNVLDALAGDDRFIELRKKRPVHRTLTAVQRRTEQARDQANDERDKFVRQFDEKRNQEQQRLEARIEEIRSRPDIDPKGLIQAVGIAQEEGDKRLRATVEQLQRERDREVKRIERELALEVGRVQYAYKLAAVALPPLPPLALALAVFLRRRTLEKLGVPKGRRRAPD